jgi:quinol-cytochrome oxidoreductase complex cytochrome b subunit
MVSNRFRPRPPEWGLLVVFTILALIGVALSRYLTNPVPRQMALTGAVVCGVAVVYGLYLKYRDTRKNRCPDEDKSNPK